MEKQVPVCTVRKKIGANFNFHEYLLLGRSESHISLTFPPHQQIFMEIAIFAEFFLAVNECISYCISYIAAFYRWHF